MAEKFVNNEAERMWKEEAIVETKTSWIMIKIVAETMKRIRRVSGPRIRPAIF